LSAPFATARLVLLAAALATSAAAAPPVAGRVTGVVRLAGPVPPPRPPIAAIVDPDACGPTIPDESLVVDGGGGVRDAVVVLRGVGAPAPAARPEALIDNTHCRFAPHVQVVTRGQTVRVRNSDPVLHNTHATVVADPEVPIANLALAIQGQTMDLSRRLLAKLPEGHETLVRIGCDVHPWMRGWLVVLDHPYGAVTDAAGRFAIADVPRGTYTLAVWHEQLGRGERPVTVRDGEAATADIELHAP